MSNPTHYEVLGVDPIASYEEIKEKYRSLIRRYHPDKCTNNADLEKAQLINAAWSVLQDEETRQVYDAKLRNQQNHHDHDPNEMATAKLAMQLKQLHEADCPFIKTIFLPNHKYDPDAQKLIYVVERHNFLQKVRNLSVTMVNEIHQLGMLTFINETTEMFDALLKSSTDPIAYKNIMLNYAEKFISEHKQHPRVQSLADEVNKILDMAIKVKLYQVHGELLEQEANRIKNSFSSCSDKTKKKKYELFMHSLKDVAHYTNQVAEDLNNKKENLNTILNSEALLFAKDTLNTVKSLELSPTHLIQDKNRLVNYGITYQQNAKEPGRFHNFLKAAVTVATMGLEAILYGTIFAGMYAFVGGLWGGLIGSFVSPAGTLAGISIGAGIGGGLGGIAGFSCGLGLGYFHGKSWTKFNGYSISRALMFMPQDLRPELSQKIVERGQTLLSPNISKSWFGCFSRKEPREDRAPVSSPRVAPSF